MRHRQALLPLACERAAAFRFLRAVATSIMACGLALLAWPGGASAQTFKMLYAFTGGSDGSYPISPLIADSAGNLYGTTYSNSVFKLAPNGALTALYTFSADQGGAPAQLIRDSHGYLYGTTWRGGLSDLGTIVRLSPDGIESVRYSFCTKPNCFDGFDPTAGLMMDAGGNLYGMTLDGGRHECGGPGCGVVYRVSPDGEEKTLYSFCSQADCADGTTHSNPVNGNGLIMDKSGNLYGLAPSGGGSQENCPSYYKGIPPGCGTLFKLAPDGTLTVLYAFKGEHDGADPVGTLVTDAAGNFYGTTLRGGDSNCGIVFKVTPNGTESVLYKFSEAGCNGSGGVTIDQLGNLYVAVWNGVVSGTGTVIRIAPDGTESVLHDFERFRGGWGPENTLLLSNGSLYGAAANGGISNASCGNSGCGTIFRIGL